MLDKRMIHVLHGLKPDGERFHHTIQNGVQFKTYELLISGIFHLLFSDCGWSRVTETVGNKARDERGLLYFYSTCYMPALFFVH